MNSLKIKKNALKYLGYYGQGLEQSFEELYQSCYEEIELLAHFKCVYATYDIDSIPFSLDYKDLNNLLKGCHKVIFISCTLGIQVEQKVKYYSRFNLTRMCVLDSIASAYIEEACDEFEEEHFPKERTFRFCPGYGNVPISLNKEIATYLNLYRQIGVSITDSDLLLPQKSMIGIIGIGKKNQKSCLDCMHQNSCPYKKRGQTCY